MKTFLRKCLVLIAMLAPLCGVSAQEAKTVTFTTAGSNKTITNNEVTITTDNAGQSSDGFSYTPYRIYQNSTLTFKPVGGGEINKIVITLSTGYSNNTATNLKGLIPVATGENCSYTESGTLTCTWEGSSTSVEIKNTIKQLRASSIEVTYTLASQKDETSVAFADNENKSYTQGENGGTVTFANIATLTPSEAGSITYSSDNTEIATVDTEGNVTVNTNNVGTATITASFAETDTYAGSSASYTITVTKALTSVAFADGTNRTYTQGENDGTITFTDAATLTPSNAGSLTYTSDKPEIATVDENGQVTVNTNNIGTATITASFAETDTHEASSTSYTVTVEKAIISGAENYVKIADEDDLTGKYVMVGHVGGTGTNAGDYIMTKHLTGGNSDSYYTAILQTLEGDQIKEISDEKAEEHAIFTFEKQENGYYAIKNTKTGMYIKCSGTTKNAALSEVETFGDAGTLATIDNNTAGDGKKDITFDCTGQYKMLRFNASSPRFSSYVVNGQQPVQLFRHGYSRDVTSGNFGTLCLPYGGTISGATLYAIEGKQMENGEVKSISLVEVDKVEAGKPYIFQAAAEKLVVYYEGDIQATAGNDNGLLGSYNGTAVEAGKYVISNNTVKKCGEGSKIGKNRCYIDMDNVPEKTASAAALIISFNDSTDAIESIEANADSRNAIYDLSGRRVKAAQKGLYIVNGKKIIK